MLDIRPAVPDDIPWLLEELQEFDKFFASRLSLFPDIEVAEDTLRKLIASPQPFFVAEDAGQLQGFIAGILSPHFFNPNIMVLTEIFWWVPVAFRGSRAGVALFQKFEDIGHRDADWIVMSLEIHSPISDESLIKRGFIPHEKSFLYEVQR
jgi:hypothetical protein